MRLPKKRWELALIGAESGTVRPVPFLQFWRRSTAEKWVRRMNRRALDVDLVRWEVQKR